MKNPVDRGTAMAVRPIRHFPPVLYLGGPDDTRLAAVRIDGRMLNWSSCRTREFPSRIFPLHSLYIVSGGEKGKRWSSQWQSRTYDRSPAPGEVRTDTRAPFVVAAECFILSKARANYRRVPAVGSEVGHIGEFRASIMFAASSFEGNGRGFFQLLRFEAQR